MVSEAPPARKRLQKVGGKQEKLIHDTPSPVNKVRRMRDSPFNKKSAAVMAKKDDIAVKAVEAIVEARPKRASRKPTQYVLSDSSEDEKKAESESESESKDESEDLDFSDDL
jgi:DNA topoisomerase-2